MISATVRLLAVLALMPVAAVAQNCGWSHVDHRVTYEASGIWDAKTYR